ncbi:MAG: type II secretion system minor pseudopilin GspK [Pseudomonadota bacterium]|nr:type II secretion system minor pseudopilin GspK [Pseudomonadota bacterium]
MRRASPRKTEAGVALVTVLMIVAAMSTVAIMLSSAVLASTSRAKALDASAQTDWFVSGAEEFAELTIEKLVATSGRNLFDGMPALSEPMTFQIDGGVISINGRDATNCLNVNALRSNTSDGEEGAGTSRTPRDDFKQLLELAELEGIDVEALTASLVDWVDADQSPGLSGAEDSYYSGLVPAYRTSGQPLQNLSELRAIRYYTPELIDALRPLLCAMPDERPQVLNINTLREEEAALLSLAMSGALPLRDARDVIFQRPAGGWESVGDMLSQPDLAQIAPELRREEMLSVQSSHIGIRTVIEYRGLRRIYDLLLLVEETGNVSAIRRERKG